MLIIAVVAGINWAANDAATKGIAKKSVANMSLGGGFSQAINDAVTAAVAAGTTYAVAAGVHFDAGYELAGESWSNME